MFSGQQRHKHSLGGEVRVMAGRSTVHTGGLLSFVSSEGTATTSGAVKIRSTKTVVSLV